MNRKLYALTLYARLGQHGHVWLRSGSNSHLGTGHFSRTRCNSSACGYHPPPQLPPPKSSQLHTPKSLITSWPNIAT